MHIRRYIHIYIHFLMLSPQLKDRITRQVSFFQQAETKVVAGRGGKERQRRWWRIEKLKELYVKSCV